MSEISLETIYNIIELYKYSETEGEKAEMVITPENNNSRKIRIGLNGGLSKDYYEYVFEDGISFDKEVLPLLVNRFLKDDKISSWVTKDPEIPEIPIKELIVSEKENEILVHTFDKELHNVIKDNTEKLQLKSEEVEFTPEEKAVEKVLKYLREKYKARPELSKLDEEHQLELIAIIDNAYKLNKGKTLTDEQIYNFADNIHDGISKECYNAIVNDIRNNNSKLINEVRSFLRNEHKYENYLDEEPYMSLKEIGDIISEKGYFSIKYAFPQKSVLDKFDEKELEEVLTSGYKSKYKFLAELKNEYNLNENKKYVGLLDNYINYLVKTTRSRMNKKNAKKDITFKENIQNYKQDDKKTLIDALKLYKGGKLDSEKLDIVVKEQDDCYEINIRLSNGVARDNNIFKFSKTDLFKTDILPSLVKEFELDDKISSDKENESNKLFVTEKGNELLVSNSIADLIKSNSGVQTININSVPLKTNETAVPKVEKENIEPPKVEPVKFEPKEEPLKTNETAVPKIEKENIEPPKVEPVKNEPKVEIKSEPKPENDTLASDSKYLASYFRKVILRDKGMLSPSGLSEIKELVAASEDVKALEEAREKMQNGEITKDAYDKLYSHYRSLLSNNISRGLKRNPVKEEKKEDTNSTATAFDFLHDLLLKYKVQNINGELKTLSRKDNLEVTFNSDDELLAVEFASYWNSAAGVKSINDGEILGETYAFGKEGRTLFDILLMNTEKEGINIFTIKEQFARTGISTASQIYERLFRNDDHIEFVKSGLRCFKKLYQSQDLNVSIENIDAKEINEEYKKVDLLSDYEDTANLVIEYLDNGFVEVKVEDEKDNNTRVTLYKKMKADYFNDKILDEVIRNYVKLDGVFKTRIIENTDSNKCGLIAIGKNSNVLQIRDIDKKYLERIDSIIDENKEVLDYNKSYGIK